MNDTILKTETITDLKKNAQSVEFDLILGIFDDITKEEINKLIEKIKKL